MWNPFNPFNSVDPFILDNEWAEETAFFEKVLNILNITISQMLFEGKFEIGSYENVSSEKVENLDLNPIKNLRNLYNVSKFTEGVLNAFVYSDYGLFIVVIVIVLLFGITEYFSENKTNIYVLIASGLFIFGIDLLYHELALVITEKRQIFLMVFLILSSILLVYYYIRMSKIMYFLKATKRVLLTFIKRQQQNLAEIVNMNPITISYYFCFTGFTIEDYNPLKTYSSISLLLSLFFFCFGAIVTACKKYILRSKLLQNIVRNKIVKIFCMVSVLCEIFFLGLTTKAFNVYLFFSNGFLLIFMLLRFGIINNIAFVTTIPIWLFSIIMIFALMSTILRTLIKLGYAIETASEDNPMRHYWVETAEILKQREKIFVKSLWTRLSNTSKENQDKKFEKISFYALGITTVGVGLGAGVWWKLHQENQLAAEANQRAAEANQHAQEANIIAEQLADMQAAKDGFISEENYHAKWDEFGNRK